MTERDRSIQSHARLQEVEVSNVSRYRLSCWV